MSALDPNRYRNASFLLSANAFRQLPADQGYEVAFAGRSNAGKSSALNTLSGQKRLARISKTPGRTQLINFFQLGPQRHLVDLPGYGYAKVPLAVKQHWQALLEQYLRQRAALRGLIIVMDVRHPLTELDAQLLDWCQYRQLASHVLLTKADKLKRGPAKNMLLKTQRVLEHDYEQVSVQLFSAFTGQGLETLYATLDQWLFPATG